MVTYQYIRVDYLNMKATVKSQSNLTNKSHEIHIKMLGSHLAAASWASPVKGISMDFLWGFFRISMGFPWDLNGISTGIMGFQRDFSGIEWDDMPMIY